VLAKNVANAVDDRPGLDCLWCMLGEKAAIVAVAEEAEVHTFALLRYRQTPIGCDLSHFWLGVVTHREAYASQLFLAQHVQHVRLILGGVDGAQQPVAIRRLFDARVMTCCQIIGSQRPCPIEKEAEADLAVALDAGIGRAPQGVLVDVELHDAPPEEILDVDNVEGDFQRVGDPAGICHLVRRAATVERRVGATARLAPQPQHHAHHVVAFLLEQGGGDRTIDAATHGDDDPGLILFTLALCVHHFLLDVCSLRALPGQASLL
jgi:hypothetical protein